MSAIRSSSGRSLFHATSSIVENRDIGFAAAGMISTIANKHRFMTTLRPIGLTAAGRSAMASVMARRRCPELVFVEPRFDVYREISARIRSIFAEYTALIEPLSPDEAYLPPSCRSG